ncbi:hypothetical protein H8B02_12985 [Bradyrhizobium sp. Pear77]|uniref:hypothetical protein n=1 Tax=Bradyrhizobium altum TaxID=1571202 RepID=UPI001E43D465|nr:hypothetical protein [Bradyrhizobium altum]MCC8954333.1 hypothetical protein [Bradyrhizobium altum]
MDINIGRSATKHTYQIIVVARVAQNRLYAGRDAGDFKGAGVLAGGASASRGHPAHRDVAAKPRAART